MNSFNELRNDLYCVYCNKQCKNLNSLKNHECRCKENINRRAYNHLGLYAKNNLKGQTKDTSIHIQNQLKSFFENKEKGFHTNYHSIGRASTYEKEEKRKLKISTTAKNNTRCGGLRKNSGRGKKGWYKGIYCRSTYELVYVIYNLDNNIKFEPCKRIYEYSYKGEKHKYYPDFELDNGTIIEIKGYSNEQTKAKINSVKDRPIKVLYKDDLDYAFKYVYENYNYNKLEDLYD